MYSLYWSHILSQKDNKKQNKKPKHRKIFHISYHVLVPQLCPTLVTPWAIQPARLFCPWNSPGKNTGAGSHSLLQEIFANQRSNLVSCIAGRFYTIEPPGKTYILSQRKLIYLYSAYQKSKPYVFLLEIGIFTVKNVLNSYFLPVPEIKYKQWKNIYNQYIEEVLSYIRTSNIIYQFQHSFGQNLVYLMLIVNLIVSLLVNFSLHYFSFQNSYSLENLCFLYQILCVEVGNFLEMKTSFKGLLLLKLCF